MRTPIRRASAVTAILGLLVAACTGGASPSVSVSSPSVAPSPSASEAASPSPTEDACAAGNLATKTAGTLTIGTDNPAFPPWFGGEPPEGSDWQVSDPASGEGYESAVAYAIAEQLGFERAAVDWIYVPFNQSFAPGDKAFDFDINQISYSAERAQVVDFSDSYYDVSQALVAVQDTPAASATSLADLKTLRIGAPVGTTSYQTILDVIQPSTDPAVFNTLADAVTALNGKTIDALVADLPTAFFLIGAEEVKSGVLLGQLPPSGGEQEYFGVVLQKDSPLTECVDHAIATLREDGALDALEEQWIAEAGDAPVLE